MIDMHLNNIIFKIKFSNCLSSWNMHQQTQNQDSVCKIKPTQYNEHDESCMNNAHTLHKMYIGTNLNNTNSNLNNYILVQSNLNNNIKNLNKIQPNLNKDVLTYDQCTLNTAY